MPKTNTAKANSKGFIIVATGDYHYGQMAVNLAASIKSFDKNNKIALAYTASAIQIMRPVERELIDFFIEIPKEYYEDEKYFKIKTHLDQLTPFENTIYCDADTIFFNKSNPANYFDLLKNETFSAIIETNPNYTNWGKDFKLLIRSEFLYFKKHTKFWNEVRKSYNTAPSSIKRIAQSVPDEYAFNFAIQKLNIEVKPTETPFDWALLHGRIPDSEIFKTYKGISVGGNGAHAHTIDLYNRVAQYHFNNLKLGYAAKYKAKRNWNDKRKSL